MENLYQATLIAVKILVHIKIITVGQKEEKMIIMKKMTMKEIIIKGDTKIMNKVEIEITINAEVEIKTMGEVDMMEGEILEEEVEIVEELVIDLKY